jgi:NADPH-dependent 2,4-dienoyl-CoA reductase/sulfur reductase-like enzyme
VSAKRRPADTILVVGAGLRGLTAAATLAERFAVQVVERDSHPGGASNVEEPTVTRLLQECDRAGVRLRLNETALGWRDGRLVISGPRTVEWVTAAGIVLAGGSRPSTLAELGAHGDRPAGILAAPAAIALLRDGARLARMPLALGSGSWAQAASDAFRQSGAAVCQVSPDPGDRITVHGQERVSRVTIEGDKLRLMIECDLLVLAARPVPMRSVQGAVFAPTPSALFLDGPLQPALSGDEIICRTRAEARRFPNALDLPSFRTSL